MANRIHSDIKPPRTARSADLRQGGAKDIHVFLRFSSSPNDLTAWWSKAQTAREFEQMILSKQRFYDAPQWFDTDVIENGERYAYERRGVREEVYLDHTRGRAYYMFLTW